MFYGEQRAGHGFVRRLAAAAVTAILAMLTVTVVAQSGPVRSYSSDGAYRPQACGGGEQGIGNPWCPDLS